MKKMLSVGLMLFALVFMLVGCQMSEEINDGYTVIYEETENSENNQEEKDSGNSQVENISSIIHKLGRITYVDETYISVNIYETDNEIYEYKDVDFSAMTASAATERIDLAEAVEYYKVYDGVLLRASSNELAIGKYVLIEYADGLQKIIIYTEDESTEENTESEYIITDAIAEE